MREDDIVRLSLRCASLAAAGAPYQQVLADGIAAILDTDAGTGVLNWTGTDPLSGGSIDVAAAAVRPFTRAQAIAAIAAVSPQHPVFSGPRRAVATHRVSDLVCLPTFWETDIWRNMHGPLDGRYPAAVVLRIGRRATLLIGLHRAGRDFDDDDMDVLEQIHQPLVSALAFRAAWDDAIRRVAGMGPAASGEQLTRREEQVIGLVALGWTNARIGRHLRISERTVRKHLENVNGKLGSTNRASAVHRWQQIPAPTVTPTAIR